MKFEDMLVGVIIIAMLIFFAWALAGGIAVERAEEDAHNRQQIAECQKLGGFARTTTGGYLIACTFPVAR